MYFTIFLFIKSIILVIRVLKVNKFLFCNSWFTPKKFVIIFLIFYYFHAQIELDI